MLVHIATEGCDGKKAQIMSGSLKYSWVVYQLPGNRAMYAIIQEMCLHHPLYESFSAL